jgi:type I restriction enzyme S subunit
LSSAYNERQEGIPLIQGNNDIKERKTISRIWTSEITKIAEENDIIMTVRAPVGCIGVATERVCIGRGVCSIRGTKINPSYILKFLESYENKWKSLEQGSTFTAVNSGDIRSLSINVPKDKDEQNSIANILAIADNEITTLEKKLTLLKDQKKYLLNTLITGDIRTPENLTLYS